MSNVPSPNVAIYAGGNPASLSISTDLFNAIGAATYSTVILWAAHVDSAGDIGINGTKVATGGQFSAEALDWANLITGLPSTVERIELCIGGDSTSFKNIQKLIDDYGPTETNPLYGNLQVLQQTLGLDAINYDDEKVYDLSSSTKLAQMCVSLNMNVSICPYNHQPYWNSLIGAINDAYPGTVDAVYLQCYDGGASNSPVQWTQALSKTGLQIVPGLWARHGSNCESGSTADQVQDKISGWQKHAIEESTSLAGGFIYSGTNITSCPGNGSFVDYSNAIINGIAEA
jgi:hypothetical protein